MRRKPSREGQLWWQEWALNILGRGRGRWILVIGLGQRDNPTVHTALASRAGDVFMVDVTEHSLRPWEADETFYRVQ